MLFEKAALQKHAQAQLQLGLMYVNGVGIKRDLEIGCAWLKKSADQGNVEAQYNLGVGYLKGLGVEQSDINAAKMFSRAAEQELPIAQYYLGYLYLIGKGVEQDFQKAIYLISSSASNGCEEASQLMEKIQAFLLKFYQTQEGSALLKDLPAIKKARKPYKKRGTPKEA